MDALVIDIAALREGLGLSQEAFAAELGVNRSNVSRWENGQTHPRGPALKILQQLRDDLVARQSEDGASTSSRPDNFAGSICQEPAR